MSSGYICQFKDLEVRTVFLDDILAQPELIKLENMMENVAIMEAKVNSDFFIFCAECTCSFFQK